VNLSGCSGGFVSQEGLIVTNHHCAFGAVQQASTVQKNYVKDGFLARSRPEEIQTPAGFRVLVLKGIEDVTDHVIGANSKAAHAKSDRERFDLVERARKEIVAQCETRKGVRCQVNSFYDGLQYKLQKQLEIKDVRVVYSPPRAIGEYGGEIDNWKWPRHTGDFAIFRAYVSPSGEPADYSDQNVPYHPQHWFRLSKDGVKNGDLVLIAGYPGKTMRFLTASGVKDLLEWYYPLRSKIYSEWIAILEEAGKADPDIALRTSTQMKSLANREKNARGQIAGLLRNRILEKTETQEMELKKNFQQALESLESVLATARSMRDHDFYLSELPNASNYLGSAMTAVRFAKERRKPDLERDLGYQDRDLEKAKGKEKDRTKTLAPAAERKALAFVLNKIREMPESQSIKSLKPFLQKDFEQWLTKMDSETTLKNEDVRVQNVSANLQTLEASKDPYIQLALAIDKDMEENISREKVYQGALLRTRPAYLEALKNFAKETFIRMRTARFDYQLLRWKDIHLKKP
jgi:Peptidase S46